MNWPNAARLALKAYCPECPHKRPIIRDTRTEERYAVVCPTDAGHSLSIAKSMFRQLLERWRQGEQLFSLEGLIFTNALRGMERDYEEDDKGRVIRIGREWWPGYIPKEDEMSTQALVEYTPSQLAMIRNELAVGTLSDQEFNLFLAVCRRTGLDPFARQIYAIKYEGKNPRMSIITGIDGFRLTAQRTESYAGSDDPVYSENLINGKFPETCTVTVYRIVQGQRVPFTATVHWEEFSKRNGQIKEMYLAMPHQMMAVRAESHAIRKGFAMETMDLQLSDEAVPVVASSSPQPRLNTQTGEIVEGSYTEGHKYMTHCPLHDTLRFEEKHGKDKEGKPTTFWSHPVPKGDPYTEGKLWCNQLTALRIAMMQSREAIGWTDQDMMDYSKTTYNKPPSGLSAEQRCEVIDFLQALLVEAFEAQPDAEAQETAEVQRQGATQENLRF